MKTTKKITRNIIYAVIALFLINISACKKISSYDYPPSTGTADDYLKNDGSYSIFYSAIVRAGLVDLFKGNDAYTVYAPNNTAMTNAGYSQAVVNVMLIADLTVLVKNHVVAGAPDITTLSGNQQQTTLSGLKISIQKIGDLYYANGGDVTRLSQPVTKGFVNPIVTCLTTRNTLMDAINGNANFSLLVTAIARANTGGTNFTALLSGSTPYIFFAPTNTAFANTAFTGGVNLSTATLINAANATTLANMLKYQLMPGASLTTAFDSVAVTSYNGTPIYIDKIPRAVTAYTTPLTNLTYWFANGVTFGDNTPSNLLATNGVIHGVTGFFTTPVTTNTLAAINANATLTMFSALIQRASTADPKFNFAAWLADPLKSYTVFAVNNAGLQAAGYADIAAINAADPVELANILKLHMIAKRISNLSVAESGAINTLLPNGNNISTGGYTQLTFNTSGGYKIKGPTNSTSITVITPTNVVTTNGMLNIIGTLLKP